ncbi:MAG: NADH-quinone oxidoreductase subunit C [Planctomycetota bacterium]|nr:NADH-quinone oxidoreductase subunit C [Planctomycetota bacterium]
MAVDFKELEKRIREKLGADVLDWTDFRGQACLLVKREAIVRTLLALREDAEGRFDMFTDLTCLDTLRAPDELIPKSGERFVVVYHLTGTESKARIRVKACVPEEPPEIDTATGVYLGANWAEREVFDMFGVVFKGHPDLRRILMPEAYEGHPLRKDYPLKGRGERDNFPKYTEIPEA